MRFFFRVSFCPSGELLVMVKPLKAPKKAPYKECSTQDVSLRQTLHADRCNFSKQLIKNYLRALGTSKQLFGDNIF